MHTKYYSNCKIIELARLEKSDHFSQLPQYPWVVPLAPYTCVCLSGVAGHYHWPWSCVVFILCIFHVFQLRRLGVLGTAGLTEAKT